MAQSLDCAIRCLAEFADCVELARPILGKQSTRHVAVKRRERPIAYAGNKPVFHGVDVAIFDVAAIVLIVPDQVLQKRRCQMPRSPRARRTLLRRSVIGIALENTILISRQRVEKSASPSGRVQIA